MLPNQTLNAILSSLRTFDPLSDTLDILIISFVFYQLLQFARKSRAGQLVKGTNFFIISCVISLSFLFFNNISALVTSGAGILCYTSSIP